MIFRSLIDRVQLSVIDVRCEMDDYCIYAIAPQQQQVPEAVVTAVVQVAGHYPVPPATLCAHLPPRSDEIKEYYSTVVRIKYYVGKSQ